MICCVIRILLLCAKVIAKFHFLCDPLGVYRALVSLRLRKSLQRHGFQDTFTMHVLNESVSTSQVLLIKALTYSSSELAVCPLVPLDSDTQPHCYSVSLWKTHEKSTCLVTLIWMCVYINMCVRSAGSGTHMTATLLQLGLFWWTVSSFSCPLTPSTVCGHKHLPGTNVLSDSLTAQTQ